MSQETNILPQRVLLVGGAFVATLVLTVYAYTSHKPELLGLIPAFTVAILLVSRLRFSFALTIALSTSALTLPGLPSKVNLYMLMAALVSGALTARAIITKDTTPARPQTKWIVAMGLLLLGTAGLRGFGLRSFGGESWGGFNYIVMLLSCFFFLASNQIQLSESLWRRAITWMCLCTMIPVVAQALYAWSNGRLYHVFYVVAPEFQVLEFMHQREAGTGMARLQQANIASQYLFILVLLLANRRSARLLIALLLAASFVLAGVAGNRIAIVFNGLLTALYLLTDPKTSLIQVLTRPIVFVTGVAVLFMGLFAQYLPMNFQRIISFLPFANVSWEVKLASSSTISWRFEVWAAALRQVPDYLLVGKGFAFSAQEVMTISARQFYTNDIEYVLASRNYHNGMIHTLLDLGLPGLLISLGFIVSVIRRHHGLLRRTWNSTNLQHMHRVFYAVFVTSVLVYFVVAGGVTHLTLLFFWTILLEGFLRADQRPPPPAPPRPFRIA